ncbi:MAG: hypothetical protein J3T61_12375, partial [Candidatus Brocadiales bacterium]|nr:hypothetical protein [Candidatus Bathyanammoxibius sp.]
FSAIFAPFCVVFPLLHNSVAVWTAINARFAPISGFRHQFRAFWVLADVKLAVSMDILVTSVTRLRVHALMGLRMLLSVIYDDVMDAINLENLSQLVVGYAHLQPAGLPVARAR